MATFTKIPDEETPVIDVDVSRRLSKIDPMTYGGFTEHMGRCIYGGIYEPGSPLSDEHGYRTDVLSALRELDVPVIRYPGGNFIATYHWEDAIGPKDQRPKRPELAWLGVEPNTFGTDEFMHWLSVLSEGREQRALAWVEYCNGTRDTYWANKRRENGHPEPYNVKYWALGNEVWGPWQVEQMTKEDYAKKAFQWAKALRLLDPNLVLILCGQEGYNSWDHHVLKECVQWVDMHSIHLYTCSNEHLPNVTAPLAAERAIETAAALIDVARIEAKIPPSKPPVKICFDEWNVWDPVRAPGELGAEEVYTLSDALAVAVWLNVFIRQSKWIGMANIAQSINVISPLMTTKEGIVKQTTWWPLLLFSKYMQGWTLGVHVRSGSYTGHTKPEWLQGTLENGAPWLDVSASVNEQGIVSLVAVNIGDKDLETAVKGVGAVSDVQVYRVAGPSIQSANTAGKEEVAVQEDKWDAKASQGKFVFAKNSMTMLRWKHTDA
ncbi:alpha-N-arabinofuranosidase [Coniochaeta sp. 2T2.1]|nr:alpha-N-arabinofuranosidase [Coniochaeta sp. 2T2.1]